MKMTIKKVMAAAMAVALLAVAQPVSAQSSVFGRVQAFQTLSSTVWLSAGRHRVVVDGDGDTDLDLYVYDQRGRLLAVDDDLTDYCIGEFYLPAGGYVRIVIENLGSVWNEYELRIR